MTNNKISLKEFCEKFWLMEQEFKLLELEVSGVFLWQAYRLDIYYLLAKKLGILQQPQNPSHERSNTQKIKKLISQLTNLRQDISFAKVANYSKTTDQLTAIIEHPRSKAYKGEITDIYSHDLFHTLKDAGHRVISLSQSHSASERKLERKDHFYLDFYTSLSEIYATAKKSFSSYEKDKISKINKYVTDSFGIELNLYKFLATRLHKFIFLRERYLKLFKRLNLAKLYVVVSYQNTAAISAAKILDIEVIEIQHGTFSQFHLGYSYPSKANNLAYIPDTFLAWSDAWNKRFQSLKLPVNCITNGFPYLDSQLSDYKKISKKPNQLVVLSQGVIGEQLAKTLLNEITHLSQYQIYYKLHPGEYSRWKEYPALVSLSQHSNVTIVCDCDLYELLSSSAIAVGVFSTALYEAIELGCSPFLVDLPGIEYMEELLALGEARYFDALINPDSEV